MHNVKYHTTADKCPMTNPYLKIGSLTISLVLLPAFAGCASASGTLVTVEFSGTETGVASPMTFKGSFTYDSSLKVSATAGLFDFIGSPLQHELSYTLGSSP